LRKKGRKKGSFMLCMEKDKDFGGDENINRGEHQSKTARRGTRNGEGEEGGPLVGKKKKGKKGSANAGVKLFPRL